MPRLDLQALRAFVAIAEEGSIRKAADRLHIAQPPLTRRLRALEDLLGSALVVRNATGVSLTQPGEELLRRARKILAEADQLVTDLRERAAGGSSALSLGVSSGIELGAAERLGAAWKRALGARRVAIRSDFTQALLARLRSGELAFAIVGLPVELAGFRVREIYAEPMIAALPSSHPAARKRAISLADLAGLPFFWNRRSFHPGFHDECGRIFRAAGFRPHYNTVEPAQILTLERIARGEGCTLLNKWRANTRIPGLAYRPLAEGSRVWMRFATAVPEEANDPDLARVEQAAARALKAWANATRPSPGRRA